MAAVFAVLVAVAVKRLFAAGALQMIDGFLRHLTGVAVPPDHAAFIRAEFTRLHAKKTPDRLPAVLAERTDFFSGILLFWF
jgi:hypothetical protein